MTSRYEISTQMRWRVDEVDDKGMRIPRSFHQSEAQARDMVRELEERARVQAERKRKARAQQGKWTPQSLRAAMTGPHWQVSNLAEEHNDPYNLAGRYQCFWRELDAQQPYDREGRPNYDIYGEGWTVECHDEPGKGDQFTLSNQHDERLPQSYLTADRLAAALIRRGLLP